LVFDLFRGVGYKETEMDDQAPKKTLADDIPNNKAMASGANAPRAASRRNEHGLDLDDLPEFVRCVEGKNGTRLIDNTVYRVCRSAREGERSHEGKLLCRVFVGSDRVESWFHRYKEWVPLPGDHVSIKGDICAITGIDPAFFGPNHPKTGIRVLSHRTGLEGWEGVHLDCLVPVLGKAPHPRYWTNNPAEKEVEAAKTDDEITLAEALFQHTNLCMAQREAEGRELAAKRAAVEEQAKKDKEALTGADKVGDEIRMCRILQLRKDIPETERKLAAMKEEYKRLEG